MGNILNLCDFIQKWMIYFIRGSMVCCRLINPALTPSSLRFLPHIIAIFEVIKSESQTAATLHYLPIVIPSL
jgi:hypothetical protein